VFVFQRCLQLSFEYLPCKQLHVEHSAERIRYCCRSCNEMHGPDSFLRSEARSYPGFIECLGSLPCSSYYVTGPYLVPDELVAHPFLPVFVAPVLSSYLGLNFPCGLRRLVFRLKFGLLPRLHPYSLHVLSIFSPVIISP
jgi:hypothetical protein